MEEIIDTRTRSREETLRLSGEEFKDVGHNYIENMLAYFLTIDVNEDGLIDYKEL